MKSREKAYPDPRTNKSRKTAITVSFITAGLYAALGVISNLRVVASARTDVAEFFLYLLVAVIASLLPLGLAFLAKRSLKGAGISQVVLGGLYLFHFVLTLIRGNANGLAQVLGAVLPAVVYLTPGILCLSALRKGNEKRQPVNRTDGKPGEKTAGSAKQGNAEKQGGFEIVNGEIVAYTGHAVDLHIPETIDGQRVTKIGIRAFCDKNIESVTIPSTVKEIKGRAFEDNQISRIDLPENLEIIETAAFGGNRLTEISLPQTLTKINHGAFKNNKLTEVRIPDSVVYVGEYAFAGNPIKSVSVFTKQILDIGSFCEGIAVMERCKENKAGQDAENDDNFEYRDSVDGNVSIEKYIGTSKDVVIPGQYKGKGVDSIADSAFRGAGIASIVIPDTIKVIGEEAFYDNQLTEVEIPDSVEVIYSRAFQKNKLSWLKMSQNLNQLGMGAFTENHFTRVKVAHALLRRNEFMRYMLTTGFDAGVKIDVMPDSYYE